MNRSLLPDKKKLSLWIGIFFLITYGSFKYINTSIGNGESLFHIRGGGYLFLLLLVSAIYYFLDAFRLGYILKTLGEEISLPFLLRLSFINVFLSSITPMATGGGFLQIYLLNKRRVRVSTATAATTLRTTITLFYFILAVPVSILFLPGIREIFTDPANKTYAFSAIGGYLLFLVIIVKLALSRDTIKKYALKLEEKLRKNRRGRDFDSLQLEQEIDLFYDTLKGLMKKPRELTVIFLVSFIFLISLFTIPYILLLNFNGTSSYIEVLSFQSIVTFFTYFAITPGASGIAEITLSLFYKNSLASYYLPAFVFMWRFFTVHIPLFLGGICTAEFFCQGRK